MKKNKSKLSSLLTSGSILLLTLLLVLVPGNVSAATSTITQVTTASNVTSCTGNNVTATINGGTVTFTNRFQKDIEVGAASYKAFEYNIDTQELFDSIGATVPACGTLTLTVATPPCNYQLDAFIGPVLKSMNGQRYASRLIAAKDMGTNDFCAAPSAQEPAAQQPQNANPEAVLSAVQIPAGLPQTGLGNSNNDTTSVWMFIGLIILLSGVTTFVTLYHRKVQK